MGAQSPGSWTHDKSDTSRLKLKLAGMYKSKDVALLSLIVIIQQSTFFHCLVVYYFKVYYYR